jgi:glycosyltransferase involved in cell wall biosynthesis
VTSGRAGRDGCDRFALAVEIRVSRTPDGAMWAAAGFGHDYWASCFGAPLSITLLARVEDVAAEPAGHHRLDGDLVEVLALPPLRPNVRLPIDAVRAFRRLWSVWPAGPVVLRLPGITASLCLVVATLRRRPFAVQVVGDPIDVAFRAGVGGVLGRPAGVLLWATTRFACRRASAAAYVTSRYLQRRYPPGRSTAALAVSDVQLAGLPVTGRVVRPVVERVLTVGSLDQPYKRIDLLIEAIARLRAAGTSLAVDVLGSGRVLDDLRSTAWRLGVDDLVTFHGHVDSATVAGFLRDADLFVLCSDTEGLPRALVEALAAGVPAIGSHVGGIPELLPPVATFRRGSVDELVDLLGRVVADADLRQRLVVAGTERAGDFTPDALARSWERFRAAAIAGNTGTDDGLHGPPVERG